MAVKDYPNDADGDALRAIAARGNDMARSMIIDFHIDAPTEEIADTVMARLERRDFVSDKLRNETDGRWTVTCPVEMAPDYDEIVYFQKVLDEDLAKFDAKTDGWGTFGNANDEKD